MRGCLFGPDAHHTYKPFAPDEQTLVPAVRTHDMDDIFLLFLVFLIFFYTSNFSMQNIAKKIFLHNNTINY